jgi:hypothetical protein
LPPVSRRRPESMPAASLKEFAAGLLVTTAICGWDSASYAIPFGELTTPSTTLTANVAISPEDSASARPRTQRRWVRCQRQVSFAVQARRPCCTVGRAAFLTRGGIQAAGGGGVPEGWSPTGSFATAPAFSGGSGGGSGGASSPLMLTQTVTPPPAHAPGPVAGTGLPGIALVLLALAAFFTRRARA